VKSYWRRRLVDVQHRVICGTRERVPQVLLACGRQSNTACVERLNVAMCQRVAAGGRWGHTRCQGEDGLQQPLAVCQV
jgi:hypothetical protein